MDLSEMQTRVAELEQQISALPAGSVTKKNVRGKVKLVPAWHFLSVQCTQKAEKARCPLRRDESYFTARTGSTQSRTVR